MSSNDPRHFVSLPVMPKRPRLRFIEGAPAGAAGTEPKPVEPKPVEPAEPATGEQTDLEKALADAEKWKSLSRKNEDQAKANADKAKKFDEHEEANKTELQKMQARAETAEKKLADIETESTRAGMVAEIAKTKGVPAKALRGSTRDELEAHADELAELLPKTPEAPGADGQGKTGDRIGDGDMSADDIVAEATAR